MIKTAPFRSDLSVIIRPESDKHTLCVEMTGLISRQDHYDYIVLPLAAMVKKDGWYNFLIYYSPSFKGWEQAAAEQSMQSVADFGEYARRLAYVNPPEKIILRNKLSAPLLGGEIRYFDTDKLQEAVEWVKGGQPT